MLTVGAFCPTKHPHQQVLPVLLTPINHLKDVEKTDRRQNVIENKSQAIIFVDVKDSLNVSRERIYLLLFLIYVYFRYFNVAITVQFAIYGQIRAVNKFLCMSSRALIHVIAKLTYASSAWWGFTSARAQRSTETRRIHIHRNHLGSGGAGRVPSPSSPDLWQ